MLFELLIAMIPIGIALLYITEDSDALFMPGLIIFIVGMAGTFVLFLFTIDVSNNCARIIEQDRVIQTYEQKKDSLYERLSGFDFRSKQPEAKVLLNQDTPVKTITLQLERIEDQLASARRVRDEAWVSYRAAKIGPFNHVFRYIDCEIE